MDWDEGAALGGYPSVSPDLVSWVRRRACSGLGPRSIASGKGAEHAQADVRHLELIAQALATVGDIRLGGDNRTIRRDGRWWEAIVPPPRERRW